MICTPNSSFCDGKKVMQCAGDGLSSTLVKTCATNQYCEQQGLSASCKDQLGVPDSYFCLDKKVMLCNASGSGMTEVKQCGGEEQCIDGECVKQVCSSLSFDGQNDYVEIPNSVDLDPGQSFSVVFWFKTDNVGQDKIVLRKSALQPSYWIWVKPPLHLEYGVYIGSKYHGMISVHPLTPQTWYHFAMTYDGTTLRGYIDGLQDGQAVGPGGAVNSNTSSVMLGYGFPGTYTNAYFQGSIDDLAFLDNALSAQRVQLIVSSGLGSAENVLGLWHFDELSGTVAKDDSGHGHDGTIYGAAWVSDAPSCLAGAK